MDPLHRSTKAKRRFSPRTPLCALAVLAGVFATSFSADGVAPTPLLAGDDKLPASPDEALAMASPWIAAAKKAGRAETPELAKGIRRAVDVMQTQLRAAREVKKSPGGADADAKESEEVIANRRAYMKAWNESLTLSRFHGNSPTGLYEMTPRTAADGTVLFGLPMHRGWRFDATLEDVTSAQFQGQIVRRLADLRVTCSIRIWIYMFDTTYGTIGGENAQGHAEAFFETQRDSMKTIESRSPRPMAKPLSRRFNRAHTFEICGVDTKGARVRIRHYFTKGSTRTYHFEVVEYRDVLETDARWIQWQKSVTDPELEAVLDSLDEGEPPKSK